MERYDRKKVGSRLTRLHQEDFCQALAYSYKVKYEKDGGPTFEKCYRCIEDHSTDLPEDLERLSPHYDMVSTKLYTKISSRLAMSIGGSEDSGTVTGTHWSRLAKEIQMGSK